MSYENIYYTNNPKKDNRESTIEDVKNPLANPIKADPSESLPLDKLVGIAVDILKKKTENDNVPLDKLVGIAVDILKKKTENDNVPLDKLVGIAVDILKKKTENDNVPLDKLVGIAVDILKKKTENDNVPLENLVGIAVDILKKKTENDNVPLENLVGIAVDILKKKTENDNVPLDKLVGIAVEILKKKTENDNVPLDKLVGIAVEILKKTTKKGFFERFKGFKGFNYKGFLTPFKFDYTLPTMTMRLKDIKIFRTDTNYYDSEGTPIEPEEQPETGDADADDKGEVVIIEPVYDGTNITITAYKIFDGENGSKEKRDTIDLGDLGKFSIIDLQDAEKKEEIIEKILQKMGVENKADQVVLIENYLGELVEAVNRLKGNVDGLSNDVYKVVDRVNNGKQTT